MKTIQRISRHPAIIAVVLSLLLGLLPISSAHAHAYLDFKYGRQITIDQSVIGPSCAAYLTDFPFLVKIYNDAALKSMANGGHVEDPNGWDIISMDADAVVVLDHEVEQYDPVTGTLVAWVRIPTLTYDADTTIWMYYGNSDISSPTEDPEGVWDLNYMGVWHLKKATN